MILRLLRGGSYLDTWILRPSDRDRNLPENRFRVNGFRLIVRRAE